MRGDEPCRHIEAPIEVEGTDHRLTGVGYIPAANLVGRAEFLFFSTNGEARFWEVWYWPWAIRFNRLFMPVD